MTQVQKQTRQNSLLQTRTARLITGSGPWTSRSFMFGQLEWLLLQHRQNLHRCTMVYKCQNNLASPYLCEQFLTHSEIHSYVILVILFNLEQSNLILSITTKA